MKVVVINGSPRRDGLVSQMLGHVAGALPEGCEVEMLFVRDMQVRPCTGCMKCRSLGRCVLPEDDAHRAACRKKLDVLLVDDGGQQAFAHIFDECRALGAEVAVHAVNQGKGRALKTGLNAALNLWPDLSGVVTADGTAQQVTQGADGFTFTISADGTELYVFYVRNTQSYRVYHLTYGTDISKLEELTYDESDAAHKNGVLLPVKTGTGRYGEVVTAQAADIAGMSCVSAAEQRISLRPQDEQNYIIFYYETKQYTVEYTVWPYGGGSVSPAIEVVSGTEALSGSTAEAEAGYAFQGWYRDEACTVPVPAEMKLLYLQLRFTACM